MHEIVGRRTTVEEARKRYAEEASVYAMNRPAPYTEECSSIRWKRRQPTPTRP